MAGCCVVKPGFFWSLCFHALTFHISVLVVHSCWRWWWWLMIRWWWGRGRGGPGQWQGRRRGCHDIMTMTMNNMINHMMNHMMSLIKMSLLQSYHLQSFVTWQGVTHPSFSPIIGRVLPSATYPKLLHLGICHCCKILRNSKCWPLQLFSTCSEGDHLSFSFCSIDSSDGFLLFQDMAAVGSKTAVSPSDATETGKAKSKTWPIQRKPWKIQVPLNKIPWLVAIPNFQHIFLITFQDHLCNTPIFWIKRTQRSRSPQQICRISAVGFATRNWGLCKKNAHGSYPRTEIVDLTWRKIGNRITWLQCDYNSFDDIWMVLWCSITSSHCQRVSSP